MSPRYDSLDDRHQRALAHLEEAGTPEAREMIHKINALAKKFMSDVAAVIYGVKSDPKDGTGK